MTFQDDIDTEYQLALFFKELGEDVENDYLEGRISRQKRNGLIREVRLSRNATMRENDPLTKRNEELRKVADCFFKDRQVLEVRDC